MKNTAFKTTAFAARKTGAARVKRPSEFQAYLDTMIELSRSYMTACWNGASQETLMEIDAVVQSHQFSGYLS